MLTLSNLTKLIPFLLIDIGLVILRMPSSQLLCSCVKVKEQRRESVLVLNVKHTVATVCYR